MLFVYSEHAIRHNNLAVIGQLYQMISYRQALLDSSHILLKKSFSDRSVLKLRYLPRAISNTVHKRCIQGLRFDFDAIV